MSRSTLFAFIFLFISVTCYQCPSNNDPINPDLTQTYYSPPGWTEDQPIPVLDAGENCMMQFKVPYPYYANVTFHRQSSIKGYSYVIYSNNELTEINNNDHAPFIFVSPNFKVVFQSPSATEPFRFAFKIEWTQIYPVIDRKVIDIYQGKPPVAVVPNNKFNTFRAGATSMMSLMAFSLADPSMNNLLRQSAIYSGDTFEGDFIGTLDKVLQSKTALSTFRSVLSVYTFGLNNVFNYPLYMGQDLADSRKYYVYQGANCPSTGNCKISLNGEFGISLTVTDFDGSEFLKTVDPFPASVTINVYENRVSNTTRIASLNSANYLQLLPLEIKRTMKFYELLGHEPHINITVSRDSTRASRISY